MASVFETYENTNSITPDGDPAGGAFHVKYPAADGIHTWLLQGRWQSGPVAENGVNGVGVENLLLIAADRLRFYQNSRFSCAENADALESVERALERLRARTARREGAGVEGRNIQMAGEGEGLYGCGT